MGFVFVSGVTGGGVFGFCPILISVGNEEFLADFDVSLGFDEDAKVWTTQGLAPDAVQRVRARIRMIDESCPCAGEVRVC